jgi:hypothetical protein
VITFQGSWRLKETGWSLCPHAFAEALGKKKADFLQDVEREQDDIP